MRLAASAGLTSSMANAPLRCHAQGGCDERVRENGRSAVANDGTQIGEDFGGDHGTDASVVDCRLQRDRASE